MALWSCLIVPIIAFLFAPRNISLYPGYPLPEQAWSEYRYTAYCYVMPRI